MQRTMLAFALLFVGINAWVSLDAMTVEALD